MIYLDNASTTKIDPDVFGKILPYLKEEYGNAGAIYGLGKRASDAIGTARKQVAEFINAKPGNIIFTSGATESNNAVVRHLEKLSLNMGFQRMAPIVISAAEHDSVRRSVENADCDVRVIPIGSDGSVDLEIARQIIESVNPVLVSVMYVNNETGAVNDVKKIGEICRENGAIFHVDATQAAGIFPIDVKRIDCDFLTLSGHKIHGPKGVGVLYVRDDPPTDWFDCSLIYGGLSQEFGARGGTENVAAIVGMGAACEIEKNNWDHATGVIWPRNPKLERKWETSVYCSYMKWLFYKTLSDNLKAKGEHEIMHVNGPAPESPGKILNLRFDGIDAETLVLMLDSNGICVSAGSACRSHESEPSRVLLAMGLTPDEARSSVRVSFSRMNTEDEVIQAAETFAQCVYMLK